MENDFLIRLATPSDYADLGHIMFDAVRNGESPYSEAQRRAWVPVPRSGQDWRDRLDAQSVVVAQSPTELVGFMSLACGGYIDLAYIRPRSRHSGLFRLLYNEIESIALRENVRRLWVHASLMARPAFAAVGFRVTRPESVSIGQVTLDRFEMEKYTNGVED